MSCVEKTAMPKESGKRRNRDIDERGQTGRKSEISVARTFFAEGSGIWQKLAGENSNKYTRTPV